MKTKSTLRRPTLVLAALIAVLGAVVVSGCGSDDPGSASATGNGVDLAFVQEMVPHHNSAVAMATTAQKRSDREEIKGLAADIIKSQSTEIAQMEAISKRLTADGVKVGELGVPEHMMGMSGDETALETASPFDREFIDMMVPHHQGAIVMARVALEKGESDEVKALAQDIIDAQSREIGEMNTWRAEWYGAASPAGGVPEETSSDSTESESMPGHSM
ncbi:DUF305 domain-containing protein [Conexibacter sp. W3-3-2]|uniref:DUF305 domain-containing protein n=1 Tax=Conexibacter sp. W3-3-2 TaxID=2675227 RepID=UPI0012B7D7F5|nr:DUF305 domain-containing protein [Conexibacter sp. W3-3-2]MTD43672.1 DUF305 domain-containing protein [Conexibacter sp. W3-3-2]